MKKYLTVFISIITKVLISMRIVLFPKYADRVVRNYWNNTSQTHYDMNEFHFDFYYHEILNVIRPEHNEKIFDYACGGGQISYRFKKDGYNIECCEISELLIKYCKENFKIDCLTIDQFFTNSSRYNVIFINNAFFYIHPRKRKKFLKSINSKLTEHGKLYILDEPDLDKLKYLKIHKLIQLGLKIFPVYQIELAGFFNNTRKTKLLAKKCGFSNINIIDSWTPYRSHIILQK